MKNTTFAIIAGIGVLGTWITHKRLNNKARKYYENGPATKEVEAIDKMIEFGENRMRDYDQLMTDEKKAADKAVKKYMQDIGYKQNRSQIKSLEQDAKKQLQKMLDKDPDILKLKKDRDFSLAGLKATLEYDKKIAKLKKQIEKAEEEHKARLEVLDAQDSDMVHETITALKHASETKKDEIVAKAQEAINDLEEKVNDMKEEWESKILEVTLEKKTEMERERARLEEQTRNRLNSLDNDISNYRKQVTKEIAGNRSEEACNLVDTHDDDKEALVSLRLEREETIERCCEAAGPIKMLVSYLKSKGVSKAVVATVGSLPIVGILAICGFSIYKYATYFATVLKAY